MNGGIGNPESAKIRAAIDSGDLESAEQLLRTYPSKDAEWNFLWGRVYYQKGWLNESMRSYKKAAKTEPYNTEYAQALEFMKNSGRAYRQPREKRQRAGRDGNGIDCCCECAVCVSIETLCECIDC